MHEDERRTKEKEQINLIKGDFSGPLQKTLGFSRRGAGVTLWRRYCRDVLRR
jgi:hypothetical protein